MKYKSQNPFGFEQLDVYQAAREFRKRIYRLAGVLPASENLGLKPQMKGAAISVTNNIAEGHGRYHWQENTRFCRISRGSLCELIDDINICIDEEYAKREHLEDLKADAAEVVKLLNGYIAYLQRQRAAQNEA